MCSNTGAITRKAENERAEKVRFDVEKSISEYE
jgi:hypothetical protein